MTPRRRVPLDAGLPSWLGANHPIGLTCALLTLLLAVNLFVDGAAYQMAQSLDPELRAHNRLVTSLGNSAWVIVLGLGLVILFRFAARRAARSRAKVLYRHAAALAGFVLLTVALSGVAASLLKQIIGRARPGTAGTLSFDLFRFEASWASFPSGHATTIFALVVALICLFPRLRLAFLSVAFWVALSRVLIGRHWISDIIAGALLGIAFALVLRCVFARRGWAFVWRDGHFRTRMSRLPGQMLADTRKLARIIRTHFASVLARRRARYRARYRAMRLATGRDPAE